MPVKLEDRPIEKVREEAIDKLIVNYSHGIISAAAFERRLDEASATDSHQVLMDLVEDLPMEADSEYDQFKDKQFTPNYQAGNDQTNHRIVSILSSGERSGQWVVPKEIVIYGGLGSTTLDFTDAIFQHQHVTIRLADVMSSTEIFVPENVNVSSSLVNIASSVENKSPSMGGRQAPVIHIEGWSVLSSVEISVKRTMKEKFIAFANSIREAFNDSSKGY
ncbi:MAG: DUF1707 and DUF2154 domain-containing protein [Idiomarina sp.]|nr:DUF1707 and DUF2154 domain-containing protein [Idiomarina sp.]